MVDFSENWAKISYFDLDEKLRTENHEKGLSKDVFNRNMPKKADFS